MYFTPSHAAKILVADDKPENIKVLFDFLNKHGFKVLVAEDGEDALVNIQQSHPDLVLLDIMMPGLDGYETCRQLKDNPDIANIPVIFMSALTDTVDKLRGFELGAVDYITKPFQHEEVLARINTHLTIGRLEKELRTKNSELTVLNQEKNEFLGIVAHDLKNPLSAIQSLAELIAFDFESLSKQDVVEYTQMITASSEQMFDLITNLLDVNAIESGHTHIHLSHTDLTPTLQQLADEYYERARTKNIKFIYEAPEKLNMVIDSAIVRQILDNLLSNAIKYSPENTCVEFHATFEQQILHCRVIDQGPGLSAADQAKLFNKFTRLTPKPTANEHSTGLGLFIVHKLVEALQGRVWCESKLKHGATFAVELPSQSLPSSTS